MFSCLFTFPSYEKGDMCVPLIMTKEGETVLVKNRFLWIEVFFQLTVPQYSLLSKEFVVETQTSGTWRQGSCRNVRGALLIGLLFMSFSACFVTVVRTTSTRVIPHTAVGPFNINHHSRKCTTCLPTGQYVGEILSVKVLFCK